MAGYDGYSKSNNALVAESEGKFPLTAAIKTVRAAAGCTAREARAVLLSVGPCEWHHTSKKYNRTEYYDVQEAVDALPEFREEQARKRAAKHEGLEYEIRWATAKLAANKLALDLPWGDWPSQREHLLAHIRDCEADLKKLPR